MGLVSEAVHTPPPLQCPGIQRVSARPNPKYSDGVCTLQEIFKSILLTRDPYFQNLFQFTEGGGRSRKYVYVCNESTTKVLCVDLWVSGGTIFSNWTLYGDIVLLCTIFWTYLMGFWLIRNPSGKMYSSFTNRSYRIYGSATHRFPLLHLTSFQIRGWGRDRCLLSNLPFRGG